MLPYYVALVSEIEAISASELTRAADALQKQVIRDFGPIWDVQASVSAFTSLEDVPIGYWPIMIRDDIGATGAAGVHLDKDGQPFALVQHSNSWPLAASHECLEMLADPFGNRLTAGPSPMQGQGRVEFLVEVCDPCEDFSFAYSVNGFVLSDFYTPHFFDPVQAPSVRYSYTGAITRPRDVLKGGYLSWHDPVSDHWWQIVWFDAEKSFKDLGVPSQGTGNLRSTIDSLTPRPELLTGVNPKDARLVAARATEMQTRHSTNSKAAAWRKQIETLKQGGQILRL